MLSENAVNLKDLLVGMLFNIDGALSSSLTTKLFINDLPTLTGYRPLVNHPLRIFLQLLLRL